MDLNNMNSSVTCPVNDFYPLLSANYAFFEELIYDEFQGSHLKNINLKNFLPIIA